MKVVCHTNLDLTHERWPDELPAVPRVGDEIVSATVWRYFSLTLEVVKVTWTYSKVSNSWYPHIELHMTNFQRRLPSKKGGETGSITAFYEWYAPLVGRSVGAFI